MTSFWNTRQATQAGNSQTANGSPSRAGTGEDQAHEDAHDQDQQQRLEHDPADAQGRVLVADLQQPLREHEQDATHLPQLGQAQQWPLLGGDDLVDVLLGRRRCHAWSADAEARTLGLADAGGQRVPARFDPIRSASSLRPSLRRITGPPSSGFSGILHV